MGEEAAPHDAAPDRRDSALIDAFVDAGCDASAVDPLLLNDALQIAVGNGFACAVRAGGSVVCWGQYFRGQLGFLPDGGLGVQGTDYLPHAFTVPGVSGIRSIAAGDSHACAVDANGHVWCWGSNSWGQLGEAVTNPPLETTAVASNLGVGGAIDVSAGDECSCAVIQGASVAFVQCTGSNASGQLGATPADSGAPVTMPLPVSAHAPAVVTSSSFNSPHTVVLDTAGNAFGAGDNDGGSLGAFNNSVPAAIPGLSSSNVLQVATGPTHTCAILTDGTVQCIGTNQTGQLGRGFRSVSENDPDYVEARARALSELTERKAAPSPSTSCRRSACPSRPRTRPLARSGSNPA